MKNILLASTALVAFAGAAAADGHATPGISFSGSAELGYNATNTAMAAADDDNDGFYSDLDITAGFTAVLDNGLTASASLDLEDLGTSSNGQSYELSLTSETAGLYYGDTNFAAQNVWVSAGDMETDGFSEADGETALRGEFTFGAVSAQMSYVLDDNAHNGTQVSDTNQLSLGVSADLGNFNVVMAYQELSGEAAGYYNGGAPLSDNGDFNDAEIFGISVGTSFGGADVRLAYSDDSVDDSMGIQVSYPLGPVTATAYYVVESQAAGDNYGITLAYENGPIAVTLDYDNDQGTDIVGLEGSYDVGNGMTVFAGYIDDGGSSEYYVAGTYDLGSGAELLVSYADDQDLTNDEVGAGDYQQGTTVEISFDF